MRLCVGILFCIFIAGPAAAQVVDLQPIRVVGTEQGIEDVGAAYVHPEYLAGESSGVDIQSRMGYGFLQDVSIRGAIFEDANVSLNGISLNNPQTGHFNLSLPVVSSDIQDVDVDLNGQAMDFQLLEPIRTGWYSRFAAGMRGYAETVLSLTEKVKKSYHRFSAEGLRTDGLRDDTNGHRWAGSYLFQQCGADDDLMFYASVSEKKFGENGAYSAPWYMNEEEALRQEFVTASWTLHKTLDFTLKPYFHRTQDTFWLDRDNPSLYRNDHTTYVSGNTFEVMDPETGRFVTLGFERQDMRSTNLGDRNRFNYSGDIGVKMQDFGSWGAGYGVKATYFDQFPFEVAPHAEAYYRLSNFWKTDVKAERLFRQPSFTELYYNSPSNVGNPDLEVQRSDNVEVGLNYQGHETTFRADVFYRRQKDTIDWVRNTGDSAYQAVNAGRVNARGFDITAGWKCRLPVFDRVDLSYTRLDVNKKTMYDISKYVFDYLRDRAVMKFSSERGPWKYALKGIYEYHITQRDRWLLGAEASYALNDNAQIFLAGENLLDEDYDEFLNVQGDPFFVKAGLELCF